MGEWQSIGSLVARVTAILMLGAIRALKGHVPDAKVRQR